MSIVEYRHATAANKAAYFAAQLECQSTEYVSCNAINQHVILSGIEGDKTTRTTFEATEKGICKIETEDKGNDLADRAARTT